jgi:hypothetical protein
LNRILVREAIGSDVARRPRGPNINAIANVRRQRQRVFGQRDDLPFDHRVVDSENARGGVRKIAKDPHLQRAILRSVQNRR